MSNKRSFSSRVIACFVAISLTMGSFSAVYAADMSARRVSIFYIDGENATLSRGAQSFSPRTGQRLASGNVVTTGRDTYVYLRLDEDSLAKMDSASQMAVSTRGQNLTLTVQSGNALIHIDQEPGQETVTRIGNVGLTVRGTMYTVGFEPIANEGLFVMLSGLGYIDGYYLHPGQALITNEENEMSIMPISIEILDNFTLEAIVNNREYLLENSGFVTPAFIEQAAEELVLREIEAVTEALYQSTQTPVSAPVQEPEQVQPNEPEPPIAGPPITAPPSDPPIVDGEDEPDVITPPIGGDEDESDIITPPIVDDEDDPGYGDQDDEQNERAHFKGSGSYADPFLLEEQEQLLLLNEYTEYLTGQYYFRLTEDIAVPSNFTFIVPFNGTLFGDNHAITLSGNSTALFSEIGQTGTVKNLNIYGNVNGAQGVAALAVINRGLIDNVTSEVAVNGLNNVGGLVVVNHGIIERSAVTDTVRGINNVGGFVSLNEGTIAHSSVFGNVEGGNTVGGFAGQNAGTIGHSSAFGSVSGSSNVGGFAGQNTATIGHSSASGNVNGVSNVGGFAGQNSGTIGHSSAYGSVGGLSNVGGFVGQNSGIIEHGAAFGSVSGVSNVGGFVGQNAGTISNITVSGFGVIGLFNVGDVYGNNSGTILGYDPNYGYVEDIVEEPVEDQEPCDEENDPENGEEDNSENSEEDSSENDEEDDSENSEEDSPENCEGDDSGNGEENDSENGEENDLGSGEGDDSENDEGDDSENGEEDGSENYEKSEDEEFNSDQELEEKESASPEQETPPVLEETPDIILDPES